MRVENSCVAGKGFGNDEIESFCRRSRRRVHCVWRWSRRRGGCADAGAGLQVEYYYGDFGHVDEVLEYASRKSSAQGEPLPNLDSRGGAGKKVLNQKHRDFVAAIITGFINFSTSGTHMIKVRSNDGVRIAIGGLDLPHLSGPV